MELENNIKYLGLSTHQDLFISGAFQANSRDGGDQASQYFTSHDKFITNLFEYRTQDYQKYELLSQCALLERRSVGMFYILSIDSGVLKDTGNEQISTSR